MKLDRAVFALKKVKKLLDMCCKFRKKWSEQYGKYLDEEYSGIEANYADSLIYAMQAVSHLEAVGDSKSALAKHRDVTENRVKIF